MKSFKWNLKCGETYHKPLFSGQHKIIKRIVNGENAVSHSWPFLASIRIIIGNQSEHHCGGTIVSQKHILTAAHCILSYLGLASNLNLTITGMMHNLMKVKIGIHDYNTQGDNQYDVIALDFHENFDYSDWTLVNDVMVLTLSRNIELNKPEVTIVY